MTLAAFALRLALARGDLWGDEAASVTLSLRPTGEMLRTLATAEPHPPLYPLLLKAWMRLAGTGELAVRMPSIWAGTALVPVVAALGRAAGPAVSLVAALLVALSPFLLWYATEARMYPQAIVLGAVSFLCLSRLLAEPSRRRVAAYAVATALALMTHYFVLYVGLAEAVVGGVAVLRDRRLLGPLAAGAALALAPFVVWTVLAGRIVGSYYGAQPGTVDLVGVLARTLERIPAGWSVEPTTALWVGVAAAPLVLAGAWIAVREGHWPGLLARTDRGPATGPELGPTPASFAGDLSWAWIAWLGVPLLGAMAVSVVRPMYQERYLAVVAPAYLLLAALAIGRAPRPARTLLLVGAVAVSAVPLWNMAAGRYVRSQYGSHTAEINALGRPGDAVILTGTSQSPLYDYYASQGGIGLPVFGLPRDPPATEAQVGPELASIAERFDGLWLMLYAEHDYDPNDVVERWLTTHAYRAPPRWTVNGRLIRFETERAAHLAAPRAPRSIAPGVSVAAALPSEPVAAGGLVPLRLDFTRDAPGEPAAAAPSAPSLASPTSSSSSSPPFSSASFASAPPKLRLRLIDGNGFLWGEADEMLGSGFGLPSGPNWTERRALPVLAGAPAGDYRVEAQLYVEAPNGAQPLGTLDLGKVAVAPSNRFWPGQIAGYRAADAAAPGWRLLGWADADARTAGDRTYATTVWRADNAAPAVEQVLRIVAPDGSVVSQRASPLAAEPSGDVLRVQLSPPVGARWRPGTYRYELGMRSPTGSAITWADGTAWRPLGTLRVDAGPTLPPPAPPPQPMDVSFGDAIRLRGYGWRGAPAALTLQWESVKDVETSLAVFVHLLGPDGKIVAQSDGPPAAGRAPTDGWSPGDVVDDRRELTAPPGSYRVEVGLYDPRTGARLPATSGGRQLGDAVELGTLRVGP